MTTSIVSCCAHNAQLLHRFSAHFFGCQPNGAFDNSPRADDADDARHSDADTDAFGIILEYLFGLIMPTVAVISGGPMRPIRHAPKSRHARNNDPPYRQRTGAYDRFI